MKQYKIIVKDNDTNIIKDHSNCNQIILKRSTEKTGVVEFDDASESIKVRSSNTLESNVCLNERNESVISLDRPEVNLTAKDNSVISIDVSIYKKDHNYYIVDENEFSFFAKSDQYKNLGFIHIDRMPSSIYLSGDETGLILECSSANMFIDPDLGGGEISIVLFSSIAEAFVDYALNAFEQIITLRSSATLFQILFLNSGDLYFDIMADGAFMRAIHIEKLTAYDIPMEMRCDDSFITIYSTYWISYVSDKYISEISDQYIEASVYGEVQ